MSAHIAFWLEVRRSFARWTGVVLASVLSGLLLGIFRRQGVAYKPALEMALPVGFLLALLFWIWISSRFSIQRVQINMPFSTTVPTFEGKLAFAYLYQVQVIESPKFACQQTPAA